MEINDVNVIKRSHRTDCKSVLRANVLSYKIVNLWNSLLEDVRCCNCSAVWRDVL